MERGESVRSLSVKQGTIMKTFVEHDTRLEELEKLPEVITGYQKQLTAALEIINNLTAKINELEDIIGIK